MRPPRSGGRRRKASPAARLRPFWILIVLGVLLLGGAVAAAVTWPGFAPKTIVVSGNRIVSRDEIVARAGIASNVNMWLQNPHTIAARIEAIPYVERAGVHRIPPSTIAIDIAERAPAAVLRSGGSAALVDATLRVVEPLAPGAPAPDAKLPVLIAPPGLALIAGQTLGDDASVELRDGYQAMLAAHIAPAQVRLDKYGDLEAVMRDGIVIQLGGNEDLDKKLALVDPILEQVVHSPRRVAAIDLRAPGVPVVRYR